MADPRSKREGIFARAYGAHADAHRPPARSPVAVPRIVIGESEQARIDAELARIAPAMKAKLADLAEDGLYY